MKGVASLLRGLAIGLVLGCAVSACSRPLEAPEWQRRQQKMTEITTLWAQIRDWRRAAHMVLDPTPADMFQWRLSRPACRWLLIQPEEFPSWWSMAKPDSWRPKSRPRLWRTGSPPS